jgi:hypothetical protein
MLSLGEPSGGGVSLAEGFGTIGWFSDKRSVVLFGLVSVDGTD